MRETVTHPGRTTLTAPATSDGPAGDRDGGAARVESPTPSRLRLPGASPAGPHRRSAGRWGWLVYGSLAAMLGLTFVSSRLFAPPPDSATGDHGVDGAGAAPGAVADVPPLRATDAGSGIDVGAAARAAGVAVRRGDDAAGRTRPLATALSADRSQWVEPAAVDGVGAPPGAATTVARDDTTRGRPPGSDRGGYAPPDVVVPGARRGGTTPTSAGTTVTSTGGIGALGARSTGGPATATTAERPPGGAEIERTGPGTANPTTQPLGGARSGASQPAGSGRATGTDLATGTDRARPSDATAMPVPAAPPAGPSAPSLFIPLTALSIGLLALGLGFLRQARARARRRAWRRDGG